MSKLFKKSCVFMLATVFILSITACAPNEIKSAENQKLSIVAAIFPQYDFARQIAKDTADVTMLLPPGSESHGYEPSPKDIMKIEQSDLFIYVGGESDKWIESILQNIDTTKTKVVSLMDCVDTLEESEHDHSEHTDEDDHNHDEEGHTHSKDEHAEDENSHEIEYDEHVWTSPKNAITIVNALTDTICGLDSANEDIYKKNSASYISELTALDEKFTNIVQNAKHKTMVFGDRFPFVYFARDYGLNYLAAFPGCSTETEPIASTMAMLIDETNEHSYPVVFYLENSNQKVADAICESTSATKMLFHSCHTITQTELDQNATYISLMEQNAENLKAALA